jgi:hypothetical protein
VLTEEDRESLKNAIERRLDTRKFLQWVEEQEQELQEKQRQLRNELIIYGLKAVGTSIVLAAIIVAVLLLI